MVSIKRVLEQREAERRRGSRGSSIRKRGDFWEPIIKESKQGNRGIAWHIKQCLYSVNTICIAWISSPLHPCCRRCLGTPRRHLLTLAHRSRLPLGRNRWKTEVKVNLIPLPPKSIYTSSGCWPFPSNRHSSDSNIYILTLYQHLEQARSLQHLQLPLKPTTTPTTMPRSVSGMLDLERN